MYSFSSSLKSLIRGTRVLRAYRHSSVKIKNHGNNMNDKSLKVKGGKQCITTLDGYVIPLHIRRRLAYKVMRPPTNNKLNDLPHVVFISDA